MAPTRCGFRPRLFKGASLAASQSRSRGACVVAALAFATGLAHGQQALPSAQQDRADIDRTQIIGNRELPKVLYIVPWKKPLPGDLAGRPLASVLDEALAPLDRDVFRRQVNYHAQIEQPSSSPSQKPTK
jgi:hypothetical protein